MFTIQLVLFLFLSSAALVRRAQNEFYKNDGHNPLRGLFQFEGGNIAQGKESLDSGNIQKVVGILQNNIKQWSFIESQLLEPNVNLGMPEIFIPLKHLTTTLEILGNIFFVQNDLSAAQSHLERACPLMELLPPNLLSDEDFAAAAGEALEDSGLRLLDATDLTSYLWMGTGTGGGQGQGAAQGVSADGSTKSNTYAAGCYSLLRDVYAKLYGESNNNENNNEPPTALATKSVGSNNGHIPSPREFPVSSASTTSTTLKYSPHQAGYHSFVLPNGKPREFNLKYLLSKRQQRQQMKARALYSRYNSSARDSYSRDSSSGTSDAVSAPLNGGAGTARSTKVSGAKLSMAGATAGTAFLEKSLSAAAAAQQQREDGQQQGAEMDVGHRRRNHALLLGVDGDGLYDDNSVDNTPSPSPPAAALTNPRRTSVFSGADEEEAEEGLTLPAAMPAIATDADLDLDAQAGTAGADSRKPSPLRSDVNTAHSHVRGQVPHSHRNFDFEQKLRDLRSPYEHLRSEQQLVQDLQNQNNNNNNHNNKKNKKRSQSSSKRLASAEPQPAAMDETAGDEIEIEGDVMGEGGPSGSGGRRVGLGLSSSPSMVGPKRSNKTPQPAVRGFEGSSLNHINGEDITAPGVSTSIIADDLETLLRKFVQANKRNKQELLLQARKYYDELDINFPNMDYNEYAANMDVGQAYLEVMSKVVQDGFTFVSTELDQWGVAAAEAQRQHQQQQQQDQAGGVKGKGKSNKGKSTGGASNTKKDKGASSKEGAAAPLQVTMAEKNRLLVLYAFDLVHSNPSDPSDLGLGFNRGIVDNDRGRRGDHFMVDALSDAVASLGLDNALAGLLGFHGEVNDAHKRLFPHDPASSSASSSHHSGAAASLLKDGNVLDQLTEQHLRDLLNGEMSGGGSGGGTTMAEEYLAARAAAKAASASASAAQSGASSDSSSTSSSSTKAAKTKRRKQRQQQMEGGGEYTREDNNNNYRPTNSGGGYFSGAGQDGDGAGDIFFDDDMMGGGSMRSMPTLGSGADGDWTLSLFVLFMLLTGAVVYSAYQEAARKKMASGRARSRPAGSVGGGGQGGSSGKKSTNAVLLSGTAVVDFMYAQLNGPSSSSSATEETDLDGDAKSTSASVSATATSSAVSAGANKLSWMFFKPDSTNGTASNGSHGNGSNGNNSANGSAKSAKKAASKETVLPLSDKASEHVTSTKSKDSHNGTAAATATAATASNSTSANGKTKGKKGKEKEKSKEVNAISSANNGSLAVASPAAVPPAPASTKSTSSAVPLIPSSHSNSSLQSATDDSHRSSNSNHDESGSSSDDEFVITSASSHPVSVNHRRVSWAGLIPGATTVDTVPAPRGGFAGEMGITEQGDWAEARKKGSKRNAGASASGSEDKGPEHPQPQRIALGLKDSPLYRQQPRPYQPHQQGQVVPGRGIPNAGPADSAGAAASARKPPSVVHGGQGLSQSRNVSAADIAAGVSPTAPLPYSRAAAATAAGGSGIAPGNYSGVNNVARSNGSKAPVYDLSQAKRLAEQMGGWSVGSGPAVGTAGNTSVGVSASTSGAAPPGLMPLRTVASAHTASSAVADSPRSLASGGASPANSNTATKASQQFGFSQFDLSAASTASAMNYSAGASGASWGTASTTSHPSLASLAASLSGNSSVVSGGGRGGPGGSVNSALAAQSAYSNAHLEGVGDFGPGSGSNNSAYLSDIVSFLDSPAYKPSGKANVAKAAASSSRSPMTDLYGDPYRRQEGGAGLYAAASSATATTSTVSAATLDFGGSSAGGGGGLGSDYDSLHVDEAGYYHVPSTAGADHLHQQQDPDHQSELYYQQLYGGQQYATDESAYYAHDEYQQYGEYEGEENLSFSAPERRDHGGLRQAALLQTTTPDFAPSITLEASSVYGLSPDAPSFRPSQLRSSAGTSTASNGHHEAHGVSAKYAAATDASTSGINRLSSAFSGKYDELSLPPPPPLSLSMSLGSPPSLGLFGDSLPLPALLQPSAAAGSVTGHTSIGSSGLAMFNTDDFYDSNMIDSILREAEGDGADE